MPDQIQNMTETIDGLFSELAHTLQSPSVTGDNPDLGDLGSVIRTGLESHDRLTVMRTQAHLLMVTTRLLFDFGDQLGRDGDAA